MAPATDNSLQVLTEATSNKYKVVTFAVDLTGKKLIDEICHISAYNGANTGFDQYVMTYRDISRSSVRSLGIRIFTMFGKYRVLKDMNTMKTLHTKSEYSTLNDFIKWLSDQKGTSSEGIILAFHDIGADKVTPFLMEALERYHLTDEFFKVVKGFVNCSTVAASAHPDIKGRSLTLRSLARSLLGEDNKSLRTTSVSSEKDSGSEKVGPETDGASEVTVDSDEKEKTDTKENDKPKNKESQVKGRKRGLSGEKSRLRDREINVMQSAKFRALTTYKLLQKFTPTSDELFGEELLKFLSTKEKEIQILERQRGLAAKVRSLRPIFVGRIRTNPRERSRAVLLRRYLIEAALDYETLKKAYETGSNEAIMKIVEETSAKKKKQHADELVELMITHFKGDTEPKKDINANEVNKDGSGDQKANNTDSSTESEDEEFEEAPEESTVN